MEKYPRGQGMGVLHGSATATVRQGQGGRMAAACRLSSTSAGGTGVAAAMRAHFMADVGHWLPRLHRQHAPAPVVGEKYPGLLHAECGVGASAGA